MGTYKSLYSREICLKLQNGPAAASLIVPQIINRNRRRNSPCCKTPFYFLNSKDPYCFQAGVPSAIENDNVSIYAIVEIYEFV